MTFDDVLNDGAEALIALIGLVAAVVLRRRLGGRAAGLAIGAFSLLLLLHIGGYVWRHLYRTALLRPSPPPGRSAESTMTRAIDHLQLINWSLALVSVLATVLLLAAILTNRRRPPT